MSLRERKLTEEHKRKIGDGNRGKIISKETREKISKSCKNPSQEIRKKISEAAKRRIKLFGPPMKNRHHSKETKKKMSSSAKRRVILNGAPMEGRHHSKETKKKMSKSKRNLSDETRKRMSKSAKKRIELNGHPMKGKHHSLKTRRHWGKIRKGSGSSFWKGGKTKEPYGLEFNKDLKRKIRKRDNYCCQECGVRQKEVDYYLCVHHIDYIKINSVERNLITLCKGCHIHTNFNRDKWKKHFRKIMKKKGYTYHFC